MPLRYWRTDDGSREIEFYAEADDATLVPVEVKAGRGSTVSLNTALEADDVQMGYKLIDGNVGRVRKKVTLPLYLAPFLFEADRS